MSDTVVITKEEFDSFISDFVTEYSTDFTYADIGKQVVYDIEVPDSPEEVVLRVFSTVNDPSEYDEDYSGRTRAKGYDSIKATLWHTEEESPILGRSHTKRISTWKNNLRPKLEELITTDEFYCDCSDGILVIRSGPYGKFRGCSNYPDCDYKEDL